MPRFILFPLLIIGIGALVILGGLWFLGWKSGKEIPEHLADRDLSFDDGNPNFVSSLTTRPDRLVEALSFSGEEEKAWEAAKAAVEALPRTEIIVEEDGYLRAETRTALFRFVDDIELLRNPGEKVIHIRSGSRVGKSDFDANAKRVETIRELFRNK